MLGGERKRSGELDGFCDALIDERNGLLEGMGESFKILAPGKEGSVTDDDDEVVCECAGDAGKVAGRDGLIGGGAKGPDRSLLRRDVSSGRDGGAEYSRRACLLLHGTSIARCPLAIGRDVEEGVEDTIEDIHYDFRVGKIGLQQRFKAEYRD